MPDKTLVLSLVRGELAIVQLPTGSMLPSWLKLEAGPLVSITRTEDEISIVCPTQAVPEGEKYEAGWRALKLEGKFDFSEVGILASILNPLARAGIGILAISTFDTDYILVRASALKEAQVVLSEHFEFLEA
jgi:hypothetical protein